MDKRAAIYARISHDGTGEAAGVHRQEADCAALAERRGWEVVGVYVDNDVSAYNGKPRPEYRRMLADLKASLVDVVVAWHPDRLHRRPVDLEEFIDVLEVVGASVATVQAGELDLATPSGRMVARMLGAAARHEVELKAARQRRKHEELALAGKPAGGGDRPFGFEADRVTVRPAEAAMIREAAGRICNGGTLRGVCREWNDAGKLTSHGSRWQPTPLRNMLTSPRIAGLREHRGVTVAKAVWPAIIDEATHRRVVAILNDRRNGIRAPRRYLLTGGVAVCGVCGSDLVARPRDDGRRTYVCTRDFGGCGKIRALADTLEEFVAEAVFAAIDSPELAAALRDDGGEDTEALDALQADEQALEDLVAEMYVTRTIDRQAFQGAKRTLEDRIAGARRQLATRSRRGAVAGLSGADAARREWEARDFDWRRALVTAVLERVTVGPAVRGRSKFDPDRVTLAWRA